MAFNPLSKLRDRFTPPRPVHVEELRADAVWATWSPESDGARYDVLLYSSPLRAFGMSGEQVVAVCGSPGIQRVAFLSPAAGELSATYITMCLNDSHGYPFSPTTIYRLTAMLARLLGHIESLPDANLHPAKGDTPFRVPRHLDCPWLPQPSEDGP